MKQLIAAFQSKADRLSLVLMILVTIITLTFSSRPLRDEIQMMTDWKRIFTPYQDLGSRCKVAISKANGPGPLNDTQQLEVGRANAIPFQVPFRREPQYTAIQKDQWSYVSCEFEVNAAPEKGETGYFFLGPIWGDTKIYINGEKVRSVLKPNFVSIPLAAEWFGKPIRLEITSWNLGDGAGPRSLVPLVYLPTELDLVIVNRTIQYGSTEKPLIPLGICGAMAILFTCVWFFGVRYRDVYWMIIATSLSATTLALKFDPLNQASTRMDDISDGAQMMSWAAICIAIYTFLRKPGTQKQLIGIFCSVGILYICQWLIPEDVRVMLIGRIGRHDEVVVGLTLLILSYLSFKEDSALPERRRFQRRALAVALLIIGCVLTWSGFYAFRFGLSPSILTKTTFITVFGTFMIIDLVIFQRAYFEEKSLKEEEERRRTALEDRLELGQSIQQLLMPRQHNLEFGPFKIFAFFESAEKMAGDWFTWWPKGNSFQVLCGDVVGKGPQAAIASTAILTSCHNLRKSGLSLENVVNTLNTTIHELFGSTSSSTIACTELSENGQAQLINHGFAGWIHLHGEAADLIPQRGASLGNQEDIKCDVKTVTLKPGDRLIIFSDGVAEGPRAIKKICDVAKTHRNTTLANLAQELITAGASSAVADDRTLIIIERV